MLGTARLLTFSLRALVLLIVASILWASFGTYYNNAVVAIARPLAPSGVSIKTLGASIVFESPAAVPISIESLTLHYGLILMAVIVLSAVGIRTTSRIGWLLALVAGAIIAHTIGLVAMAHGSVWIASSESPDESGRILFSLFSVFWGLLPALIGGIWCFAYWLPNALQSQISEEAEDSVIQQSPQYTIADIIKSKRVERGSEEPETLV